MSLKVVFVESAEDDIKALRCYIIKNFGQSIWQTTYAKLKESVNFIGSNPSGGRIPDELASLNLQQYRQVISGMNRIIYETKGDTVYIHIVCDSRKDFRNLLMKRILKG